MFFIKIHCVKCNATFDCLADKNQRCWCFNFPRFMQASPKQQCLCSSCLSQTFHKTIDNYIAKNGLDEMLLKAAKNQTDAQPVENIDFYIENGNYVFTKWSHLKRGVCCGNGCKYCPYPK